MAVADAAAPRVRVHARLDRPRRGRSDAPGGRARVEPAADPAARRLAPVRHRRDRGRLGAGDPAQRRTRRRCCSRGRTWRSRSAMLRAIASIARGGYVLADFAGAGRRAVDHRHGSEVPLALQAREALAAEGISVRVVSMPCTSVFDRQDAAYRASVLAGGVPRVAVEAGVTDFWRKYVGAVDDPRGARRRHRPLRRVGAGRRAVQAFRFHGRARRRGREGCQPLRDRRRHPPRRRRRCRGHRAAAHRRLARDVSRHDARRVPRRDEPLGQRRVLGAHPRVGKSASRASTSRSTRGRMIGFAAANRRDPPKLGFDAELSAIYLAADRKRQGIGRRLVAAVAAAQRERGATGMLTWVIAKNQGARAFYERLGGELLSSSRSSGTGSISSRPATASAISTRSPRPPDRTPPCTDTLPLPCTSPLERSMTIKVAINGYGRIGRNILRAHYEGGKKHDLAIVALNDLGSPETNAHLTRYDTTHGKFPGKVECRRRRDGRQRRPHQGVRAARSGAASVVVARRRRRARVDRLFHDEGEGLRAPQGRREEGHHLGTRAARTSMRRSSTASTTTCSRHRTRSSRNASCTTNCLAPLVAPLHAKLGLVTGLMTTSTRTRTTRC